MKKIYIFMGLIIFFTSNCLFSASDIPSPSSPKTHIKYPFTPGKALKEFEAHHFKYPAKEKAESHGMLNREPRFKLQSLINERRKVGHSLNDEDWEVIYFYLFAIAGAQDVKYVYHHYPDVIQVLQENYKNFDPTFTRPSTEWGEYFSDEKSKQHRPLTPHQRFIVFGAIHPSYYEDPHILYRVNIAEDEYAGKPVDLDLVADMNSATQLAHIPEQRFEKVYVEHIPGYSYYNPHFFKNAYRILKNDGELIMNTVEYMQEEPYNIRDLEEYFRKNGFRIEHQKGCLFPKKRNNPLNGCFYLKKII